MKADTKQVTLTIDGKKITVDDTLTILEAARQNDITIPTLCHHPAISSWGGCRLCVVQVDQSPKLVASCVTPVREGMDVVTDSASITASRRLTLEFLFAERNHNCMFCPTSGECELQQMAYALQMDHLTVSQAFNQFPVDTSSSYMTLDHNRCILCGRCVRACREIAGCNVLGFHNRGSKTLVGFDLMDPRARSTCTSCGACLQVCPTGALSNRFRTHYAVSGQSKDRTVIASVCAGCGLLCPTQNFVRDNQLLKVEGIFKSANGHPDRGQLCHKGRFEILKNQDRRLLAPLVKDESGEWQTRDWQEAIECVNDGLQKVTAQEGAGSLFAISSSGLSTEVLMGFKEVMTRGWGAGSLETLDSAYYRNLIAAGNGNRGALPEVSWENISDADMVILIDCNLKQKHSLLRFLLHRVATEKKLPVVTLGKTVESDIFVGRHLAVSNREMPTVLEFIGLFSDSTDFSRNPQTPFKDDRQTMLNEIGRQYAAAKKPFVIAGEDFILRDEGLPELFTLARLNKQADKPKAGLIFLTPASNSMAAWRLGMAALEESSQQMHGGVILLGEEREQALAPFKNRQAPPAFLAVITPYFNPALAEIAHVMLPSPLWLEEDGTYSGLNGTEIIFKPRVLDPPKEVKSNWEILQRIGAASAAPIAPVTFEDMRKRAAYALNATNID